MSEKASVLRTTSRDVESKFNNISTIKENINFNEVKNKKINSYNLSVSEKKDDSLNEDKKEIQLKMDINNKLTNHKKNPLSKGAKNCKRKNKKTYYK